MRKLKKLAQTHFLAGNTPAVVHGLTGISEDILQEWHDEFLVLTIKSGASRRVFLRELLLANAPAMLMKLKTFANNTGDEKLASSSAVSYLSFASRFMNEDARIMQAEQKFKESTDNDPLFSRTLFDFADPSLDGSTRDTVDDGEAQEIQSLSDAKLAELMRIADAMEAKVASERGEEEKPAGPPEGDPESHYSKPYAAPADPPDLFDGIDD